MHSKVVYLILNSWAVVLLVAFVLCEPKYTLPLTDKGHSVTVSGVGESSVGEGQQLSYLGVTSSLLLLCFSQQQLHMGTGVCIGVRWHVGPTPSRNNVRVGLPEGG